MADRESATMFDCEPEELRKLMELRGEDSYKAIQRQYGGVAELCRRLGTSPSRGIVV